MKIIIAFIVFLTFSIVTFAQQYEKTEYVQEQIQISPDKRKPPAKSHYQGIIETGYAIAIGRYGQKNIKLNIINGVRQSNYSIGIGVGLRVFFDQAITLQDAVHSLNADVQIPIFLDNRIYLSNKNISPFLSLGIGCSIGVMAWDVNAGFFSNPSVGLRLKISNKIELISGIVYEFDKTEFIVNDASLYVNRTKLKKMRDLWVFILAFRFKQAIKEVMPSGIDVCNSIRTNGALDKIKLSAFMTNSFITK